MGGRAAAEGRGAVLVVGACAGEASVGEASPSGAMAQLISAQQAAAQKSARSAVGLARFRFGEHNMWLILVEMALALALAIFIVWWTMFYRPSESKGADPAAPKNEEKK